MSSKLFSRALVSLVSALAFSQISLAAPVSGCTDNAGSPTLVSGQLINYFTCSIYNTGTTTTLNLTSVLTNGGANLLTNAPGAGYAVIITGNPLTISNNDLNEAALYNQSLWDAVLFFPGDLAGGTESDTLTVYWPGSFPAASTVQSVDEGLYAQFGIKDSRYFTQAVFPETIIDPSGPQTYDVFLSTPAATPEPGSLLLLSTGLAGLGLLARKGRAWVTEGGRT
jgi:hypothetical protein